MTPDLPTVGSSQFRRRLGTEMRPQRADSERPLRRSEATQQLLDQEVRRLINAAHNDVTDLLTAPRDQLDSLTAALLPAETLDETDAYAAARAPLHDSAAVAMLDMQPSRNGASQP